MIVEKCTVLEMADIAEGMKRMVLKAPGLASGAEPGQFVMARTEAQGAVLGRPLGISGSDGQEGTVTLRFAAVGKGTAWLAAREPGDPVELSGPLGKGFVLRSGRSLLIGGGTGLAPLFFLKQRLEAIGGQAVLVVGAKNRMCLMDGDSLPQSCFIATEDGSMGESGLVTGPLERLVREWSFDAAYACGPVPMLKAVKAICEKAGIALQVSLETKMGCGVGACNGCTCSEAKKHDTWLKVCKDGPVFDAKEVSL
ncbi:MAG TPA: dihydroorotate dehydrogenase electron transfer subunit [Bacillota bacterium]|nr:dihydroorotate dehydrogenase electron transfer subunit [Bacillota bacterium]